MVFEVRSTAALAMASRWLLLAGAALGALTVVYQWKFMDLMRRATDGLPYTTEEADNIDSVAPLIYIASLVVFVATVIVFLRWLKRSYENLRARGMTLNNTPGWAVGWWFIPFANFVKPYGIMADFWRATGKEATSENWEKQDKPPLIGWWWGSFLLGSLCMRAGDRAFDRALEADDIEAMGAATGVSTLGTIFWIVAALLAHQLVKDLEGRLQTKLPLMRPIGAENGSGDEPAEPVSGGA